MRWKTEKLIFGQMELHFDKTVVVYDQKRANPSKAEAWRLNWYSEATCQKELKLLTFELSIKLSQQYWENAKRATG